MNLSLVAYYGEKPAQLAELISAVQAELGGHLPQAFCGYAMEQVHATIIGLEGHRDSGEVINSNYRELRGERRGMDLAGVFGLLREPSLLPLTVVLGGYREAEAYAFTSRGLHPYLRSFAIHGDIAVAMGWPWSEGGLPPTLGRLRCAFERVNVLHKYHRTADDLDNDFYFVLGRIRPDRVSETELQGLQARMRAFLAAREPLAIAVGRECLSLVAYVDTRAPPDTTRAFGLDAAEADLEHITNLYPPAEMS